MKLLILATLLMISGNVNSVVQSSSEIHKHTKKQIHNKQPIDKIPYKEVSVVASWYGYESGRITASGTRFNPKKLTAAHRTLPFGTKLKVTNIETEKSVVVTVNDRGPYKRGRSIDLSMAAAKKIELDGIGRVIIEKL